MPLAGANCWCRCFDWFSYITAHFYLRVVNTVIRNEQCLLFVQESETVNIISLIFIYPNLK